MIINSSSALRRQSWFVLNPFVNFKMSSVIISMYCFFLGFIIKTLVSFLDKEPNRFSLFDQILT